MLLLRHVTQEKNKAERIARPVSVDRFTTNKSEKDLWYDEIQQEMLYLFQWRKDQMKKSPQTASQPELIQKGRHL